MLDEMSCEKRRVGKHDGDEQFLIARQPWLATVSRRLNGGVTFYNL